MIFILIALITIGDAIKKYYKTNNLFYSFTRFESFTITRFISSFIYYKENSYVDYKTLLNDYKNLKKNYKPLAIKNDIKNIVLILGESLNKNQMQLYGNQILNNPELTKLLNSNNLTFYTDTIAPFASTNATMQVLLNFANYENIKSKPWHKHLDIISLFSLAGYKTYHISNQEEFGIWGNAAASIGHGADFIYFANAYKNSMQGSIKPDFVLLPTINNLNLANKNFIIIHLIGSHFSYKERYENDFEKFSFSDIECELDKDKCQKIAQYHNSIYYNDYIISKIYEKFKNEDSLLIYISDHGESLYDDKSKSVLGHSIVDKTNAEIPLIFIYSNKFKNTHKDILSKIISSKDNPYMSDDLIHTLCDIAGIMFDECKVERSVINEQFDKTRARIFQNVDYDKRLK